jgi:hypothetical protein
MFISKQKILMTALAAAATVFGLGTQSGSSVIGAPLSSLSDTARREFAPQTGPDGEVLVYPTGVYPADVQEVNAAVNGGIGPSGTVYTGGGTILLKATDRNGAITYFHFGNDVTGRGNVKIFTDVAITGESFAPPSAPVTFPNTFAVPGIPTLTPDAYLPDGTPTTPDRTMIYGGRKPFFCDTVNPTPPIPPRFAVRNIYFAYPSQGAVHVKKCAGLEVSHCVVYDITRAAASGIPGFFVAVAIEATGLKDIRPGQANPNLYGDYIVFNNIVKRRTENSCGQGTESVPDSYGHADSGIVAQLASMNANIYGNTIYNFPFVGIGIEANTSSSTIVDNKVFNCGFGGYMLPTTCVLTIALPAGGIGARRNTAPLLIEDNEITSGLDAGGTLNSTYGLGFAGVSNAVVRSNSVKGSVSTNGIFVTSFPPFASMNNSILANNLRDLEAGQSQAYLDVGSGLNQLMNNDYGPVGHVVAGTFYPGLAGAYVQGSHNNIFVNENFWGDYTGIYASPRVPCMWFTAGSTGNTVSAFKNGQALQGFDVCRQIYDAVNPEFNQFNIINGYDKCRTVPRDVIDAMAAREAEFIAREKQRCLDNGGTWDDHARTCRYWEE